MKVVGGHVYSGWWKSPAPNSPDIQWSQESSTVRFYSTMHRPGGGFSGMAGWRPSILSQWAETKSMFCLIQAYVYNFKCINKLLLNEKYGGTQ